MRLDGDHLEHRDRLGLALCLPLSDIVKHNTAFGASNRFLSHEYFARTGHAAET